MALVLQEVSEDSEPLQLMERALGVRPLRAVLQSLSESGKSVYRVDLPDGQAVVLRTSVRPRTFAFTRSNFDALARLGLPVQSVLAKGTTTSGGSFVILNWMPGRDLIHELGAMSQSRITALAAQIVEYQQRVGALPRPARFGWAPIGRSGNLERWTQVFGEAAPASAVNDGTLIGGLRARLCTLRRRVEPYFDTVRPTAFLDDITTKNVLIENGQLSGIIDVDFVCYGDPLLWIGATMAAVAGDVPQAGAFYGEELIRCWNPNSQQRLAIWFYAALWGIGSLHLTDAIANPSRAQSLKNACETWLAIAQGE